MKTLKKLNTLFIALIVAVSFTSCLTDDDNPEVVRTLNIVGIASQTPDLSILVEALQAADGNLPEALSGGPFTVFAPTNDAFTAFLSANGFSSLGDVPTDVLSQILLNHVVRGELRSTDLSTGYGKTMATESSTGENISIFIDTASGVTLNGTSDVTSADVEASNGVIHIVDAVIGLPTVVDFALADPTFSTLVSALTRQDLTFDYVTTLSTPAGTSPAPFTVFAPTNDAFGDLLTELGATGLADIDEPTLKATLNLHAVAGANVRSSALTDNMTISTLGGDVTGNVSGGATITDVNGRISNIIVVDVQAANGVIHAIDRVILPQQPSIAGIALDTPDLSILVDALSRAGLVQTLSYPGDYTVFAPTNAAFTSFLSSNGFASLDDVPVDALTQVLLNHVVLGGVMSTELTTTYINTLATKSGTDLNLSMFVDTSSGVTLNGVSNVSTPDIEATNGIIHIVDAVIGLPTIVDHAVANPNFSSLVGALTSYGTTFTDLLSTPGDFTVFAPDNTAFGAFTNPNSNSLDQILSNHVIPGATAMSSGLENMYVNTAATFNGTMDYLSMYINTDSGVTINGNSSVTAADVVASNGVIHVVDAVIDLPTVVDFAVADPTFTTLVAALTRDDLTFDYVSTLSTNIGTSPAPFTVFAPTNDAFGSLLTELGATGLGDITEPVLKATLDHHAVAAANVRAEDLMDNMTVGTLGGDITANVTGGATLTDSNGRVSNIVKVNVQAANGVIHVIDKVVLPNLD